VYGTLYFSPAIESEILDCPNQFEFRLPTVNGPSRNLPLNLPTPIRNSPATIDIEQCHRTFVAKRGAWIPPDDKDPYQRGRDPTAVRLPLRTSVGGGKPSMAKAATMAIDAVARSGGIE